MNLLICLLYILVRLEPASKERTNSNILWLNLRQWRGDRPTDHQVEVSMIYVLRRWVCKRIFTPTLPPMVKIDIFSWEIITHILCSPKRIVRRYRRNSPVHEAFQRAPITQSLQPNIFYWRFSLYYSVYFVYSTGPGRGTVLPKKGIVRITFRQFFAADEVRFGSFYGNQQAFDGRRVRVPQEMVPGGCGCRRIRVANAVQVSVGADWVDIF